MSVCHIDVIKNKKGQTLFRIWFNPINVVLKKKAKNIAKDKASIFSKFDTKTFAFKQNQWLNFNYNNKKIFPVDNCYKIKIKIKSCFLKIYNDLFIIFYFYKL